mgnify:CR=1 FL=1
MAGLLSLDISGNVFTEFPYEALEKLEKLRKLDISRNQISQIDGDKWKAFRGLQLLDLSSNRLSEFPLCIKNCKSLKILRLIKNDIKSIPDEYFDNKNKHLTVLQELNLNSNQNLDKLNPKINELTKLKVLGISYTKITEIPETIAELIDLVQLYCYGTPLVEPNMTLAS